MNCFFISLERANKIGAPKFYSKNLMNFSATVVLGGGCFWGMEKAFKRKFGAAIANLEVGYAGGQNPHPTYQNVCSGTSGHAEVVKFELVDVKYDAVLEYFFRMHDPTTRNRQGNDRGSQYRSTIMYLTEEQRSTAFKVHSQMNKYFGGKIVTEIEPLINYQTAEPDHQDYLNFNPGGYECPTHFERTLSSIQKQYGAIE